MNAETYSYDELDQILRGDGRSDFVGISAIDGLIAAVVAGPVRPQANEWLPEIFGGSLPEASPGTVGRRAIDTILQRHDEVLAALESRPNTYRPLFMNHAGQVITRDWCVGFMLGVGTVDLEAWIPALLSEGRQILHPILACTDLGRTMLCGPTSGIAPRMRSLGWRSSPLPHRSGTHAGQSIERSRPERRP